jgi:hypothetical protein
VPAGQLSVPNEGQARREGTNPYADPLDASAWVNFSKSIAAFSVASIAGLRVGEFRTSIEDKVHVPGVGRDITENTSWAPGKLENDDLGIDGVQHFLCLRCLIQHSFAQRKCQPCHAWGTGFEKIEKLRARFSHMTRVIGSPGFTTPGSATEA